MRVFAAILAACAAVASVNAEVYFKDTFEKEAWQDTWTVASEWKDADQMGEWKWVVPKHMEEGHGLKTGQDARFYSITAPLDTEVSNQDKDLIISYTVKHEQDLDCGGAYIKLVPGGFDAKKFGGDTPYAIMFGPDICGTSTRKTHVIMTYKGENLLTKKSIRCETDNKSHRYTLTISPDNTYEVKVDGKKVESGSLADDFDFLEPKKIKDPKAKKPADWVDEAKIPDPEAEKPEGWDDEPAQIPDPDAEMPEDWDEDEDGEWEPPMIDNPEYKGEWVHPKIDNPDYKGPWVHPMIDNPDYVEDDTIHAVCNPCTHVGFELWQVKAGTVFDDIIVTDSADELAAFEAETWEAKNAAEEKAIEEEKAKEEAEREQRMKEAAEAQAAEEDEEDDEEEDDEEEL